jgi:pyruvate/2-oxoglutarate dehydrogenase complex dihydrolipoamide acyltransferase (E2) component
VRRLARELGVELSRVRGTGPDGRILREDVIAAVRHATSAAPAAPLPGTQDRDAWGPVRRETMSKTRKTIAANMVRSAFTIPHLTNFDDADITELERIRKGSVADYAGTNVKLTSLVFVMKAVALSLKQHPLLNASLDMESGEIIYKDYVNLGIAVDTERGLVVPVVRAVDQLTIPHIAQSLTTLSEKAKATQYTLEDLRGGSFTISNLGSIGGTYSTPIINYPEVGILLVGRSRKLPVVVEDRIEPRLMMPLSLSYDHRLVDGAAASRFLNEVIGYLESPGRLLLAP